MRTTAASPPAPATVWPCTNESYCSQTQRWLATFGEPSTARKASRTSPSYGMKVGSSSARALDRADIGRSYSGPSSASDGAGTSATELAADAAPVSRSPGHERGDHGGLEAPASADLADVVEALGRHDREHPLLRLADVRISKGSMPGSRSGTASQMEHGAHAGARGRLADGAAEPGAAEVLQPLQQAALDQLQRGLDQQLLGERVADLHARPRVLAPLLERRAERARSRRRCRRGRSRRRTAPSASPRAP